MIDTAAKRCSAVASRRLPWFRRFSSLPDGTADQGHRQQSAFAYRGILAGSSTPDPVTGAGMEYTLPAGWLHYTLPRDDDMGTSLAPQRPSMAAAEVRGAAVNFSGKLDQGELLTGTPTASASPGTLTCSSARVSTAALTINGRLVTLGKAVQLTLSGGVAAVEYTVTVTAQTTLGQTLVGRFEVPVEE